MAMPDSTSASAREVPARADVPPRADVHHPFPPERYLPYLTTVDVAELPKDKAAIILSIASIEQHGPVLPLVTDSLSGQTLLAAALRRLEPETQAWVIPPLFYGRSGEHAEFPGTITLSAATLTAVIFDIARSLKRAGFRRLVLLNSHGGNPSILDVVARDIRQETGLMVFNIATFRLNLPLTPFSEDERRWSTHANEWETSVIMAMAPELVRMDRIDATGGYPRDKQAGRHLEMLGPMTYAWLTHDVTSTGVLGDPRGAAAEKGVITIEKTIGRLAEVIEEVCSFEMPEPAGAAVESRA